MLTINPSELILTILNFFVLFFVLKRFFYTPLITFMDARRKRIEEGLEQEKEAFAIIRELERFLASRRKTHLDEAQRILAEAQSADKLQYDHAIAEAKQQLLEERKTAGAAALERNEEERRQLEQRQEHLAMLLAEHLTDRFSRMPGIMLMDGRRMAEPQRNAQNIPKQLRVRAEWNELRESEGQRNELEQRQLEEQREQLAQLLAETLLEQFSREPAALSLDGHAVQIGKQRKAAGTVLQMPVSVARQAPDELREAARKQEVPAACAVELRRNQEEQQQLEAQWEQLAALLAETLLCPGA